MSTDKDPIEGLLNSLSRDQPIDWDAIAREAGPEYESRIEALRRVSTIASFNRELQRGPRSSGSRPKDKVGAVPDAWGDLLILEGIASTTRSDLFRAWDPARKSDVALRLFPAQPMGPTSTAQGVDEAIGLRHANLIALLGVDQRDGRLGAWMEFLNGVTLEQQVDRNGPLLPGEVARLGMEIGAALSTLHEAGAIHRRITPSNVMLDLENRYWLAEIEIAAAGEDEGSCASSAQADISALGSVLWFAATGRTEFSRDGIARHALPSALLDAVTWAIEPEPGEEFQIARELVRTLQAMASRAAPEQRDSALGRIGGRLRRLGKSRREGA